MMTHPDKYVQSAITNLSDALCMWERATGRESVVIIREETFSYRAVNGKPGVPEDIDDADLLAIVLK
jgi:hypothetical protein